MNTADAERRIRALAETASLPRDVDVWTGASERLPRTRQLLRRRRVYVRTVRAAAAVLAVAVAAVTVPLLLATPPDAMAAAARAAAVARTEAGLASFELTEVTTTAPIGFQPEPPLPRLIQHIEYADPAHWRVSAVVTQPFHEGTQVITQIRNGSQIASVASGQTTISRASQGQLPDTWPGGVVSKLLAAGSAGRCAPSASLDNTGPLIDGRPTVVLRLGSSPCPSADTPQADGPATFWLDRQTFLVLRAVLHGPAGQVAQTIQVTDLRYHATFGPGTFRLPGPSRVRPACPAGTSLPDLGTLRRLLAYPPLLPSGLPGGWHAGTITPGATTGSCTITSFTVTYLDASGHPAVQLYEAPRASPSVRFPGQTVTIRPGLTGTLSTGYGMTIVWWIQDDRYCSLQSGGMTSGVSLTLVPVATLLRIAASVRN